MFVGGLRSATGGWRTPARKGPVAAVVARFNEIDGGALGILVSIELFTTVIPLIIVGFSYLSGFAENVSPGTVFIRNLGLGYPLNGRVREAFGASSGLRPSWTVIGVAGFLVWGIPMSITIAESSPRPGAASSSGWARGCCGAPRGSSCTWR
jgi:hypothetical protein